MELGLHDKVIVIIGGTSGIGKTAAFEFAREGSKVAVGGRSARKMAEIEDEFRQAGLPLLAKTVEAADYSSLTALAETVIKEYGKIDVWINNAGTYPQKALMEMTEDEWDGVIKNNLKSVFLGCKVAAAYMRRNKKGVILNASSYAAVIPSAGSGAYATAKVGVLWMTKILAAELAPDYIRVNAYIPGVIRTEMTQAVIDKNEKRLGEQIAMRKLGEAEDVAGGIVFLASDAASYMTGTALEISGGKFCVQNPSYAWQ